MTVNDLKKIVREVPDFPKKGILFYDLTPIFQRPEALRWVVGRLVERYRGEDLDLVAGIEARGFVLAALVAHELDKGLVLIRKPGKLPRETWSEEYALEYGTGRLEVHRDSIGKGQRVLMVDDLLATGGTAAAAARLVARTGGVVAGFAFLAELEFLSGRRPLEDAEVFTLMRYG